MHYFLQGTSVKSLNLSNVEYNYGGIIKCHHIFMTPLKLKQFLIKFQFLGTCFNLKMTFVKGFRRRCSGISKKPFR